VFLHAPQSIQSLLAGKHVLCEKPMAMNEAEARTILHASEESSKVFGVAYYRRSYPKVQRARQLLAHGAIGKPVLAELTSHAWFDGQGSRSWLVDPAKAGGGPLFDIASHRIDVLNFLFGQPFRVTAQLSNVVHHYAVEDNATVMIEYAGGVRGVVDVRWHSKVAREWPRSYLPRRSRKSSCPRQPALPHDRELRGRRRRQSAVTSQRRVLLLDRLGHRKSPQFAVVAALS
jgi:predicted dehydrogenase